MIYLGKTKLNKNTEQNKRSSARKNEKQNPRPSQKPQKLSMYLVLPFNIIQIFRKISVISSIFAHPDLDLPYGF